MGNRWKHFAKKTTVVFVLVLAGTVLVSQSKVDTVSTARMRQRKGCSPISGWAGVPFRPAVLACFVVPLASWQQLWEQEFLVQLELKSLALRISLQDHPYSSHFESHIEAVLPHWL